MTKLIIIGVIMAVMIVWVILEEVYEKGYGDGYIEGICYEMQECKNENETVSKENDNGKIQKL